ncbi:MAG: N-acetyl-gamma-glutamyl-phosphate reductase [Alphaproteobacteria bacterium]|nr:N-acetyl-gamma-glutamyl-phosphate reductase [Alphaproteobacteria bacterium]
MTVVFRAGLLGASGYTGADLLRIGQRHPNLKFNVLTANANANQPLGVVFPHLASAGLPDLVSAETVDWSGLDVVFCGLPHGAGQPIIAEIMAGNDRVRVIDMSADFRLTDARTYERTYGQPHVATHLQGMVAYGLSEHNRAAIASARIIACPGCYPTAALMGVLPPLAAGVICTEDIIIDAKSGVTGAGRGLKQNMLMAEAGESVSPYGVGVHRHAPEIDQELSGVANADVIVGFTPHLIPMSRGELVTAHVRLVDGHTVADLRECLESVYENEPFVRVAGEGEAISTGHVRGSNHCVIGVYADRILGRAILVVVIDNLVKGSAGQAIQNFNIAFGLPETTGLEQMPLFP